MAKDTSETKHKEKPTKNTADNAGQYLAMPQETAQAILSYLSTRPYREVAGLINEIAKVHPISKPDHTTK